MKKVTFRKFANTVLGIVAMAFFFFAFMKPAFAGTVQNPSTAITGREVEVNRNGEGDFNEAFLLHVGKPDQYISVEFRNPGSNNYWACIYGGRDESYQKIYDYRIYSGDYRTADLVLPSTDCLIVLYGNTSMRAKYKINLLNDDYPNSFETARQINLNTGYEGAIEIADNREFDMFKFTTDSSNSFYSVNLANRGKNEVCCQVYEGSDETYKISDGYFVSYEGQANNRIFKLQKNKTYWVKVWTYWEQNGTYRLTVSKVSDEAGDDFAYAKKLKLNKTANGAFQAKGDADFFVVKTAKNKAHWLSVKNKSSNSGFYITVYSRKDDESSKLQKISNKWIYSGDKHDFSLKLSSKHVYYIKVYDGSQNAGYSVALNQSAKSLKKDVPKSFKTYSYYYSVGLSFKNNARYDGIEIYRSYRSNGGFKKIKTLQTSSYNSYEYNASYTDSGLARRRKAYYKIRYYVNDGGKKRYGKFSSVKSGSRRY